VKSLNLISIWHLEAFASSYIYIYILCIYIFYQAELFSTVFSLLPSILALPYSWRIHDVDLVFGTKKKLHLKVAAYHLKPPLWCLNTLSILAAHKISEQLRSVYIWKVKTTRLACPNLHFIPQQINALGVMYYMRSMISFSGFLGRTPRWCSPPRRRERAGKVDW